MYDVSVSVAACVRAGTRADVAWVVAGADFPDRDPNEALVLTPGGGHMGALLGGALDARVADLVRGGTTGRLVELVVDDIGALIGGLPHGGTVRCLIVPASDFPDGWWEEVWSGRPSCLVVELDGDRVTALTSYDESRVADLGEDVARFFARGVTGSLVEPGRVVTALWPVPRLAIVGGGPIGDALETAAGPLGWQVLRFGDPAGAADLLLGFGSLDMVVVGLHDVGGAGTALAAALSGSAGYIGSLGTPAMQTARTDWLVSRGVEGVERIHGPAGLDLGARRPAEVALAIVAEALAVRSGRSARPLREAGSGVA